MKVLIAEDDRTSCRILEMQLARWGYEVISACNGNEAWEQLQAQNAPRLAILDWMMPGIEGIEICRRLRSTSHGDGFYVYVILVTGRTEKTDLVEGIEAGADDYVVKPFDPEELRVRVRAGQRIVELQSELLAAKDALTVQALHDPLTGIFNRRAILEVLDNELSRSQRNAQPLSIAMCDIDHFKNVNDAYGHQVGDEALCEFTNRVRSALRDYDFVGRYGGEEFLVVAPGVCGTASKRLFERVRASVAEKAFSTATGDIPITASFGVAACDGKANAHDLIRAADAALYRAKASGRNCVKFAVDISSDCAMVAERNGQ